MPNKLKVFFAVLGLSCIAGTRWLIWQPSDPMQKAVEAEIKFSSINYTNSALTVKNILALGPAAVPHLAEASLRTNSDFHEWWVSKHSQSALLRRWVHRPLSSREIRASANTLLHGVLEDQSMAAAIPGLLLNSNETVRGAGCRRLIRGAYFSEFNNRNFASELLPALASSDLLVKTASIYAMGKIDGGKQVPVATFIQLCRDPNESVQFEAARALLRTEEAKDEALTVLKRLTLSRSVDVKFQAACELFKLHGKDDLSLMPMFLEGSLNRDWQNEALCQLSRYGTNAAFALPKITSLLNSSDKFTRDIATDVVKVLSGQSMGLEYEVEGLGDFSSHDPRYYW